MRRDAILLIVIIALMFANVLATTNYNDGKAHIPEEPWQMPREVNTTDAVDWLNVSLELPAINFEHTYRVYYKRTYTYGTTDFNMTEINRSIVMLADSVGINVSQWWPINMVIEEKLLVIELPPLLGEYIIEIGGCFVNDTGKWSLEVGSYKTMYDPDSSVPVMISYDLKGCVTFGTSYSSKTVTVSFGECDHYNGKLYVYFEGSHYSEEERIINVDYVVIRPTNRFQYLSVEHKVVDNGSEVLHKVEVQIPKYSVRVNFSAIPDTWEFYFSNIEGTWDASSKIFTATIPGTYEIWFKSEDTWNYAVEEESRISFHTSRGTHVDFESLHIYVANSPSEVFGDANSTGTASVKIDDLYLAYDLTGNDPYTTGSFLHDVALNLHNATLTQGDPITFENGYAVFQQSRFQTDIFEFPTENGVTIYILEKADNYASVSDDGQGKFVCKPQFFVYQNPFNSTHKRVITNQGDIQDVRNYYGNTTTWTSFLLRYNATTDLIEIFENDTEILSYTLQLDDSGNYKLSIGEDRWVKIRYYKGKVKYILFFNRTLNETEVGWLFNASSFSFLEGTLIAYVPGVGLGALNVSSSFSERERGVFGWVGNFSLSDKVFSADIFTLIVFGEDFYVNCSGFVVSAMGFRFLAISQNASSRLIFEIDFSSNSESIQYNRTATLSFSWIEGKNVDELMLKKEYISLDELREIAYLKGRLRWRPVYDEVYRHPYGKYLWFNVTDIWGNRLIFEPRDYAYFQDFVLDVYSWKFFNGKDDSFIHISLKKSDTDIELSEWLAPHEITEYLLFEGVYILNVSYPGGSWFNVTLTVSRDYFWILEGNTLGDVLSNIEDLYNFTYDMNESLSTLVFSVYLNVSFWNSQINETVVNITIMLGMNNTTVGSLLTQIQYDLREVNSNISSQINWIYFNLTQVNSTLFWEVNNLTVKIYQNLSQINESIYSMNISINNQYSNISAMLIDLNSTVLIVNSTLDRLNATLINRITIISSNINKTYTYIHDEIPTIKDQMQIMNNDVKATAYEARLARETSDALKDEFQYWSKILLGGMAVLLGIPLIYTMLKNSSKDELRLLLTGDVDAVLNKKKKQKQRLPKIPREWQVEDYKQHKIIKEYRR
ncbi:MAG: hypothetical protein Q6363_007795 [Candidatus Njordarchaeota archaeon]